MNPVSPLCISCYYGYAHDLLQVVYQLCTGKIMVDESMKPRRKFHKYPKTAKGLKAREEYRARAQKVIRDRASMRAAKDRRFYERKEAERLAKVRELMQIADEAVQEMYREEQRMLNAPIEAVERYSSVNSTVWVNGCKKTNDERESKFIKLLRWLCK